MLSLLSSAAATSARKRKPGPANSARKGQLACHCDRTIGGILDVCSQDNDGSACWRTCCQACFAARDPLPHRYHSNVYHQAELAYAMVEAEIIEAGGLSELAFRGDTFHGKVQSAIGYVRRVGGSVVPLGEYTWPTLLGRPCGSVNTSVPLSQVQTIYWRLPLLNWSRAVLRTLLPQVRLVTTDAPPPTGCRGFGAAPAPGAYWRFKSTAKSLRQVHLHPNPNPDPNPSLSPNPNLLTLTLTPVPALTLTLSQTLTLTPTLTLTLALTLSLTAAEGLARVRRGRQGGRGGAPRGASAARGAADAARGRRAAELRLAQLRPAGRAGRHTQSRAARLGRHGARGTDAGRRGALTLPLTLPLTLTPTLNPTQP